VDVAHALERLDRSGLGRRVIIDASHGNSGKDHRRQPGVIAELSRRLAQGERGVVGVMLESFLVSGRQDLTSTPLVFGQSITDSCIGWADTTAALDRLAGAMARRREASHAMAPR
jgi:3-deoxy-7-phosphoheptulonate synthase